jgi:hypothetical protein
VSDLHGSNGIVAHPERMRQNILFEGLQLGKISPTDVDMLIEYKGLGYIIGEVKLGETELPQGQRIALERMVKDFRKCGKKAIAIICEHHVHNHKRSIDISRCVVREVFESQTLIWREPKRFIGMKDAVNEYIRHLQPFKL